MTAVVHAPELAIEPEPSIALEPLSPADAYVKKLAEEKESYYDVIDVRLLPEIASYWANRYVRPKLEAFGFDCPDAFFKKYLGDQCRRDQDLPNSFFSIGSGNCELEVGAARFLIDQGIVNFSIECFDLNEAMLERGRNLAEEKGVSTHVRFMQGDFNDWKPLSQFDAIIADQSLHHVVNLEGLFDSVKCALKPGGLFVVSDMVGRNGHMRWPEALEIVHEFWRELPATHRYNRQLKRFEELYENWDCSMWGFEGIRCQDIMPLLLERFHFQLFIGFANVVDVFVDRAFGHNFDPNDERDLGFIDSVQERDEAEMFSGRVKPTHMLAVMSNSPDVPLTCHAPFTPEFCTRWP